MKLHHCLFMSVMLLFYGVPNAYAQHTINYYEGYEGTFDQATNTFYLCGGTGTIHVSDPNKVEIIQGECPPLSDGEHNPSPMRAINPSLEGIPIDNKVAPNSGQTPTVDSGKNGSGSQ